MFNEKKYQHEYYLANKEKTIVASNRWREENPEKVRTSNRERATANRQRTLDKVGSKACLNCRQVKDATNFARRRKPGGDGLKDLCKPCVILARSERVRAKTAAAPIPTEKPCSTCKVAKSLSEFYRNKSGKYGLDAHCKPCKNKQTVAYACKNPERSRERNRVFIANNPYKRREYEQRYAEKHPEKVKAKKRAGHVRRKARLRSAEGSFTGTQILALMAAQDGLCVVCETDITQDYHIDHKVPVSRGGSNKIGNIQLLCPYCNMSKGSKTMEEFLRHREFVGGIVHARARTLQLGL